MTPSSPFNPFLLKTHNLYVSSCWLGVNKKKHSSSQFVANRIGWTWYTISYHNHQKLALTYLKTFHSRDGLSSLKILSAISIKTIFFSVAFAASIGSGFTTNYGPGFRDSYPVTVCLDKLAIARSRHIDVHSRYFLFFLWRGFDLILWHYHDYYEWLFTPFDTTAKVLLIRVWSNLWILAYQLFCIFILLTLAHGSVPLER